MDSRLLLIDALGMVYRAFYAIKGLATRAGQPTNAVFGFVKMLLQINRAWQPTHELVVFDGGLPAERTQLLPAYKAQRPPMPEPLRAQLAEIREYLAAARIASLRLEGKEADDILASAAALAQTAGVEVFIVSADKDLMQVANPHIAMITPGKIEERFGPDEIIRKTGVPPEKIVDWLALTGDSSDNIPGVPGIGAKTAAKLLREWGSVREIFNALPRLQPDKLRGVLAEHRPNVLRNIELITLDQRIALPCSLEDMKTRPPDRARLRSFFARLEFHSLAAGLGNDA